MVVDYLLSYTSAPLLSREMQTIAQFYIELNDWQEVEERVVYEDILQKPTLATRKRVFSELKKRFKNLTDEQVHFLANAPMDDTKVLSYIATIKTYRLIREFVSEVMREKYFLFEYELQNSDYISFIESKQAQSDKLSEISETTQKKLRQVMFKMLQEAGFVEGKKKLIIQKPQLSEPVIELIVKDDPRLLALFLMNSDEAKHYTERYA